MKLIMMAYSTVFVLKQKKTTNNYEYNSLCEYYISDH